MCVCVVVIATWSKYQWCHLYVTRMPKQWRTSRWRYLLLIGGFLSDFDFCEGHALIITDFNHWLRLANQWHAFCWRHIFISAQITWIPSWALLTKCLLPGTTSSWRMLKSWVALSCPQPTLLSLVPPPPTLLPWISLPVPYCPSQLCRCLVCVRLSLGLPRFVD